MILILLSSAETTLWHRSSTIETLFFNSLLLYSLYGGGTMSSFSTFPPALSTYDGIAHDQIRSPLLSLPSVEILSQTCLEMCFLNLGGSQCNQESHPGKPSQTEKPGKLHFWYANKCKMEKDSLHAVTLCTAGKNYFWNISKIFDELSQKCLGESILPVSVFF